MVSTAQENPERMISLKELAILANTNMITDEAAVERMRNHQKVQWNPSTDLYSYKVRASLQMCLFQASCFNPC